MKLVEHVEQLRARRGRLQLSISNMEAKRLKHRGDTMVMEFCEQEITKHDAELDAIEADFKAVGLTP